MNCIDAIEGTIKSVLGNHLDAAVAYHFDESEYVRNVKLIIQATQQFVLENPEITPLPETLRTVLYDHAKKLWMDRLGTMPATEGPESDDERLEYDGYRYDYIYANGLYPP